jgi:hypothetical protein
VWEKKEDEHVDTSGHLESDPRYFDPSLLFGDVSLNESRLDSEFLLDEVVGERLTLLKTLQTANQVSSTRKTMKEKGKKSAPWVGRGSGRRRRLSEEYKGQIEAESRKRRENALSAPA